MNRTRQIYYHAIFGAIGGLLAWQIRHLCHRRLALDRRQRVYRRRGRPLYRPHARCRRWHRQQAAAAPHGAGCLPGAAVGLVSGAVGMLFGGLLFVISGGGLQGRLLGWVLLGLLLGLGNGLVARRPYASLRCHRRRHRRGHRRPFLRTDDPNRRTPERCRCGKHGQCPDDHRAALGLVLIGACLAPLSR